MFIKNYFTRKELTLWGVSVLTILLSFLLFHEDSLLTLAASLIGVISLIFNTKGNPLPSTVSVMTSFLAVYLTYKRSSYYAVAYAANDVVLVILWLMASVVNRMYLSVAVCFGVFLLNDIYGFISWQRMKERQSL